MNESADFAERAEEIASRLNLINAAVGETVGLLTALHRDYTSAGRPWAAFCAEQLSPVGRLDRHASERSRGEACALGRAFGCFTAP